MSSQLHLRETRDLAAMEQISVLFTIIGKFREILEIWWKNNGGRPLVLPFINHKMNRRHRHTRLCASWLPTEFALRRPQITLRIAARFLQNDLL